MSNIIGLPFDDWVKSQIDVRQDALGRKVNISHDNLKYYTTKTPWLRLASSIDLTDDNDPNSKSVLKKLTDAGIDKNSIVDSNLAKNFILQGGTVSLEETTNEDGEVISSNVDLKKGLNYVVIEISQGFTCPSTYSLGAPAKTFEAFEWS